MERQTRLNIVGKNGLPRIPDLGPEIEPVLQFDALTRLLATKINDGDRRVIEQCKLMEKIGPRQGWTPIEVARRQRKKLRDFYLADLYRLPLTLLHTNPKIARDRFKELQQSIRDKFRE